MDCDDEVLDFEAKHKPNNKLIWDCTESQEDDSEDGAVAGIGAGMGSDPDGNTSDDAIPPTLLGTVGAMDGTWWFLWSKEANSAALECKTRCGAVASIKQWGLELNSNASVILSIWFDKTISQLYDASKCWWATNVADGALVGM